MDSGGENIVRVLGDPKGPPDKLANQNDLNYGN
jgi:hypothetical protein